MLNKKRGEPALNFDEKNELKNWDGGYKKHAGLLEEFKKSIDDIRDRIRTIKQYKMIPVGCFFHIHSQKDCCEYCARTLFYEFYHDKGFINGIKAKIGETFGVHNPFFEVSISFEKDLPEVTEPEFNLRPKGISTLVNQKPSESFGLKSKKTEQIENIGGVKLSDKEVRGKLTIQRITTEKSNEKLEKSDEEPEQTKSWDHKKIDKFIILLPPGKAYTEDK